MLMEITLSSHNFAIRKIEPQIRPVIESFARKYVQYGFEKVAGRWQRVPTKVYGSSTRDRTEYRFHINTYKYFLEIINNNHIDINKVTVIEKPFKAPSKAVIPIRDGWIPKDYQEPIIEYLVNDQGVRNKFVHLRTGGGKTVCAMMAFAKLGERVVAVLRPQFIEKWILDVKNITNVDDDDVLVVRGGDNLKALITMATENILTEKIILISNKTFQDYIKGYEAFGDKLKDFGYDCLPGDFFEYIGCGVRLVDEGHLDFHLNFKIDTYTHVKRSITLSATLTNDDDFVERMYNVAFPMNDRYIDDEIKKYVNSVAILYKLENPNKIRCQDYSRKTYSHNMFEQSIMKNPQVEYRYKELILHAIKCAFLFDYKPGEKCLVYCASIDFSTRLAEFLAMKLPHLRVKRYVENDPYSNLMTDSDLCVSTLQSAGTGHDIDNLKSVVLTHAIKSKQGNIQGFGRLREPKTKMEVRFYYLISESIKKHMEYHEHKRTLLKARSNSFRTEYYQKKV